ncbi:MAG: hypothetical protein ACHP7H_00625 [Hyphomicrobiales bacterium]
MANRFKVSGRSIKLTKAQTRVYEGSGSAGDHFRREARAKAQEIATKTGKAVEIYSHDGITFEQVGPEEEIPPLED